MSAEVRVWDPLLRIAHWTLVASILATWITAELKVDAAKRAHEWAGYAALAVIALAEPRDLGHNPLGGWMVMALLSMAAAAGLSGWLSVTDRFWGVEWVQELHEILANTLFLLVGLHVAGVVFTSLRHRENLVHAMVTGRKQAPRPGDVG